MENVKFIHRKTHRKMTLFFFCYQKPFDSFHYADCWYYLYFDYPDLIFFTLLFFFLFFSLFIFIFLFTFPTIFLFLYPFLFIAIFFIFFFFLIVSLLIFRFFLILVHDLLSLRNYFFVPSDLSHSICLFSVDVFSSTFHD